jgi:hydrogenase maturation protease
MPYLVIGYGNELRGDDAVGPQVARCVSAWSRPEVTGIAVHQLTPELAAILAQVELVIFVDACADPAQCEVCLRRLESGPGTGTVHTSDPRWLLALTEALFDRRPEAWLVTIPASDFSLGAPLSPVARAGVDVALSQINRLLGAALVMAAALVAPLATHFLAFTS